MSCADSCLKEDLIEQAYRVIYRFLAKQNVDEEGGLSGASPAALPCGYVPNSWEDVIRALKGTFYDGCASNVSFCALLGIFESSGEVRCAFDHRAALFLVTHSCLKLDKVSVYFSVKAVVDSDLAVLSLILPAVFALLSIIPYCIILIASDKETKAFVHSHCKTDGPIQLCPFITHSTELFGCYRFLLASPHKSLCTG